MQRDKPVCWIHVSLAAYDFILVAFMKSWFISIKYRCPYPSTTLFYKISWSPVNSVCCLSDSFIFHWLFVHLYTRLFTTLSSDLWSQLKCIFCFIMGSSFGFVGTFLAWIWKSWIVYLITHLPKLSANTTLHECFHLLFPGDVRSWARL
jgi:hypothetical protein